jgi:hypothetical protein
MLRNHSLGLIVLLAACGGEDSEHEPITAVDGTRLVVDLDFAIDDESAFFAFRIRPICGWTAAACAFGISNPKSISTITGSADRQRSAGFRAAGRLLALTARSRRAAKREHYRSGQSDLARRHRRGVCDAAGSCDRHRRSRRKGVIAGKFWP